MTGTKVETFHVPAERWLAIAESNMCARLTEQKAGKIVTARAMPYKGGLYMINGSAHGEFGNVHKPYASGYRLLPAALFEGETTTVYHDEAAINSGRRERGDLTGLILAYMGQRMVCTGPAEFIMELPSTRPLTMEEAMAFEAEERNQGWRAMWYHGKTAEWFSLNGHPVSVYRGHSTLECDHRTLLWKFKGRIHELTIADDVGLEAPLAADNHLMPAQDLREDQAQLALF